MVEILISLRGLKHIVFVEIFQIFDEQISERSKLALVNGNQNPYPTG